MKNIFLTILNFLKKLVLNFAYRVKPRSNVRWIITFSLWLLALIYVGFGVYTSVEVIKIHSETTLTHSLVKIYPIPVAFVNGNFIWAKDYYQEMAYIKHYYQTTNTSFSEAEMRTKILDQLIENRLIAWEAAKYGVSVSSKDVNDVYAKIITEKGQAEVQKVLRELYDMDEGEFKALIKDEILREKIQNDLIAQVKVAHILVKDEGRANEVANKLKSGEKFDQLAKTYSEDVKTRDSAGDLGWIARGNLVIDNKSVPEFEEAAFAAKIGEFFGPIKTQAGFQIGIVSEKKGKIQKSYADWLAEIKKSAKVYRFIK